MQILRTVAILSVCVTCFSELAFAQTGNTSFLTFDQFFQNYTMINPAAFDSSGKFSVKLGYSALTGLFEGVNRYYVDGDFKPGRYSGSSFSRIGMFVQSSNDGAFISRTRFYGRYSRSVAIGEDQSLSLGIAVGAVSYTLKGSYSFSGGNATAFDAYSGLWYHRKKLSLGISLQQISQAVLTPVQQSFRLQPALNLNAVYFSNFSSSVLLTNHIYYQKEKLQTGSLEYVPVFLFSETLETGANFKLKRGVAILIGVRTETAGFGRLRLMGSFLFSTRKLSSSADNKFEIFLGYYL